VGGKVIPLTVGVDLKFPQTVKRPRCKLSKTKS